MLLSFAMLLSLASVPEEQGGEGAWERARAGLDLFWDVALLRSARYTTPRVGSSPFYPEGGRKQAA